MRRAFWILAVGLILTIGVTSAQADTFTPTFTCTGTCAATPTAGDVSFPSPSIFETWDNGVASIADILEMAAGDNPSDTYTWTNTLLPGVEGPGFADFSISITDVTTGDSESTAGTVGVGDPLFSSSLTDSGTLTFTSSGGTTPAPEPSTVGLLLAGIGALIATRKFRA
jgi:hypothetical protein